MAEIFLNLDGIGIALAGKQIFRDLIGNCRTSSVWALWGPMELENRR